MHIFGAICFPLQLYQVYRTGWSGMRLASEMEMLSLVTVDLLCLELKAVHMLTGFFNTFLQQQQLP